MAARKDLRHSDEVRKRIQTSQLVNRLNDHVIGKVEMSPTQLRAAEILLKKSMPDLTSVALSGDGEGGPIDHVFRWGKSPGEGTSDPSVKS